MCKSGRQYKKCSRIEGIQKITLPIEERYF